MSDHAAVKEERRKEIISQFQQIFNGVRSKCLSWQDLEAFLPLRVADWVADFAREARLKEAELWMKELTHPKESRESWDWAKERIEQLKRGEIS